MRIRFIINPISGGGRNAKLIPVIEKYADRKNSEIEICLTEYAHHATVLAKDAVDKKFDIVVAVGGDGSVNEVGKALVHTEVALGIIPTGSGNGMARHLHIPQNAVKAIETINKGFTDTIDTVTVNDQFCIGTIGVSFDAHIAHLFSKAPKRGYSTYVKLVLTEFAPFPARKFSILVDDQLHQEDCFLLTFSNSSQFGNNFVIAPLADEKDGLLEISTLKKFPAYLAPSLIYRMLNNTLNHSKFFRGYRGKHVILKNAEKLEGHIDGEPVVFEGDLDIKIVPLSIKIVVPKK